MTTGATAEHPTMKAVVQDQYGTGEVLRLDEVPRPTIGDDDVLLRVRAAGINPADWFMLTGVPWVMRVGFGLGRPKQRIRGMDVAGIVEAVGGGVTDLRPGDEVYGSCDAALAEFARADPQMLAKRPEELSFEEAAALPMAALTALTGLRDVAKVQTGQAVLINGASGGIGTFAVQIARSMGAEVTGVCSTRNVELVRSLGADHVVDYPQDDYTARGRRYDLIFDNAGSLSLSACRRSLKPGGLLIPNNGTQGGPVLGPLPRLMGGMLKFMFLRERLKMFVQKTTTTDLMELKALVESGAVKPVIDNVWPLSEAAQALDHVGQGHARGKVVVSV